MVSVPGAGTGRSSILVQPQDIFATVLGIAALEPPESVGIESYDISSAAMGGEAGSREVGLSGVAAGERRGEDPGSFFTVLGDEYYLVFHPHKLERSILIRYGTQENLLSANQLEAQRLHAAGLAELGRRGADPALVDWLRRGAPGGPPEGCPLWDGYPGPPGYVTYFHRMYGGP